MIKTIKWSDLSDKELVDRFEALCLLQYRSLEREEIDVYNIRYDQIKSIVDELRSRPGDQRRRLQKFFVHQNNEVRLTAAYANLAIDYENARSVFEDISENHVGIQRLDAGMTLRALDDGSYRPT